MVTQLHDLISDIKQRGSINDTDVLALRRGVFGDANVSIDEADAVFALNKTNMDRPSTWSDFFMEGMTDFIVNQTMPHGYIDEANASWLIERISEDGIVETYTELRTLVNILKTAKNSPERLVKFALAQVKMAVINGAGVIGRSRTLEPGIIGAAEVQLLKNVLFASGGDRHIAVTRSEAEILFDLNDACRSDQNDPAWQDLFVKGITNYLMFLTTYETPEREDVLRRENWLRSKPSLLEGFSLLKFKDISAAFSGLARTNNEELAEQYSENQNQSEVSKAELVNEEEAAWLISRISKDGDYDDNEKALLRYLQDESPYLHVSLNSLLVAA